MKTQIASELAWLGRLLQSDAASERQRADRRGDALEQGFIALKKTEIAERRTERDMSIATTSIRSGSSLIQQGTAKVDSKELSKAIDAVGEGSRLTSAVGSDAADASSQSIETARAIAQKLGPSGSSEALRSVVDTLLDVPREA